MKVILLDKVERLGERGDIVEVKDGYARNYLIPRRLAIPYTESTKRHFEALERAKRAKLEREKKKAEKLANRLSKVSLTIEVKTGEEDRIFGAVSSIDILNALKEKGIKDVEKGMIQLKEAIKELGTHYVTIKLHPEVEAQVKVNVVKKE